MDSEQVESIARELERLNDLYERLMEMCPLEFSLGKYYFRDPITLETIRLINQSFVQI